MLKVVHLNSVYNYGSTGKIVKDIHLKLLKYGYYSYVAFGRGEHSTDQNVYKFGLNVELLCHLAETRILDRHGYSSKGSTERLIKHLNTIKPDIIHIHNLHGYYINIKKLIEYINEKNIRVVWTLHDCWSFTGHCSHYDYINCTKWQKQCNKCPQIREYPKSFILDNSSSNFEIKRKLFTSVKNMTIVTPSSWLKAQLSMSFMKDIPSVVITNGIDTNKFLRINTDLRKHMDLIDKFIILGVANNWSYKKGLDGFIDLSTRLQEDEMIILIGVDNSVTNKLPKNIVGVPKTRNIEELASFYSTADVFVNLTLEDTYPTVNLEAAACGTPVITYDTGGCSETLDPNSGYLIEKGNIDEVYQKIQSLKNFGSSFKNAKVKDRSVMVDEYIELYKRVSDE